MNMKSKMNDKFKDLQGGLFSEVTKADVGGGIASLLEMGYAQMAWADPFYPDASIPDSVKKVMIDYIQQGEVSHYTMPIGSIELREEIAKKAKRINNLTIDPLRNVIITPGSDSGLLYAMMPYLNEGDEVMVPDPSYPSNFLNPKLLGAVTVSVPLNQNTFQIDIDEFEKRVTSNTKMVLISHPNNPTAVVFDRTSIEALCAFVKKHNLILISDQAFEDLIYDNVEMISPASLPDMWERTITVCSISKGFGLSGFRVGYIIANDEAMDIYYGGAVNVLGATNTLSQLAAIAAFKDGSILQHNHDALLRRRDIAYEIFNSIPGVQAVKPQCAFLSWLNISKLGTSAEITQYLSDEAKVIINDGSFYGEHGEGYIRVIHGAIKDDEAAKEVFIRMKDALTKKAIEKGIL